MTLMPITKLQVPPLKEKMIPRPRLIKRMQEAVAKKLTLICAPAGSGKTTLTSAWARELHIPVAWYSISQRDNDPFLFINCLIGALQEVDASFGETTLSLMQNTVSLSSGTQPAAEIEKKAAEFLFRDIYEYKNPLVLVLDDFHFVTNTRIHQGLGLLLEFLPETTHIVISTRNEPAFPLPRLRLQEQVLEIRSADLNFNAFETQQFFKAFQGLDLAPELIERLKKATKGWAAGLQLAALSLSDCDDKTAFINSFDGEHRHIRDYLLQEVLMRQPEDIQAFLLNTSILTRLCAPLCDALMADTPLGMSSQALLEKLEGANVFLNPLDQRRTWYEYHGLFARMLQWTLWTLHPERLPGLHRRAADWMIAHGEVETAMDHLLGIPDFPAALAIVETNAMTVVGGGRASTLLGWLGQIPTDLVAASPVACVAKGWAELLRLRINEALAAADDGEKALIAEKKRQTPPRPDTPDHNELLGNLHAIRAYASRVSGNFSAAALHCKKSLDALPAQAHMVRGAVHMVQGVLMRQKLRLKEAGHIFSQGYQEAMKDNRSLGIAVSCLFMLGYNNALQGRLSKAKHYYEKALSLSTNPRYNNLPIALTAWAHIGLADICFQRDEIGEAKDLLSKAEATAQRFMINEALTRAYLLKARMYYAMARIREASEQLNNIETLLLNMEATDSLMRKNMIWTGVKLHLAEDRYDAAERMLDSDAISVSDICQLDPKHPDNSTFMFDGISHAHLLSSKRNMDSLLRILNWVVTASRQAGIMDVLLEAMLLKAAALSGSATIDKAMACFKQALRIAMPEMIMRPFVEIGRPVIPLLNRAADDAALKDDAIKVAAALAGKSPSGAAANLLKEHTGLVHIDPLNKWEVRILRLMNDGYKAKQIAEQMPLKVNTVRSYIKVIYRKLDVHSKDQAIAKAKSFGVI